jgi:hypothetical protein
MPAPRAPPTVEGLQAARVLPALAAVALAAHGVHGQGQGGVGLQADGAVRHGALVGGGKFMHR